MRLLRVPAMLAAIIAALMTILLTGPGAAYASTAPLTVVPHTEQPKPGVTFTATGYTLRYNQAEVKSMSGQFWGTVLVTAAANACVKLRYWPAQAGCAGVITASWYWIDRNFDDAAARNQCVRITIGYRSGGNWGRYTC